MAPSVADLVAVSFLPKDAQLLGVDFGDSLTATGNNSQADAYQIERNVNRFTTVTSAANSAKLPKAESIANGIVIVRNDDSADLLYLFPYSGDSINALSANVAIEVLPGSVATAYKISSTKWVVTIDAGGSGSGAPVGSGMEWYSATAPAGWLLQDGSAVSRTTYARLFAVISTTYGAGDGSTTFNLPDKRGRFALGKAASGTGSTLGGTGGSIDHSHTVPAHYHGMGAGADLTVGVKTAGGGASVRLVNDAAGDGTYNTAQALNQVSGRIGLVTDGVDGNAQMTSGTANPPFIAVNFIIKY